MKAERERDGRSAPGPNVPPHALGLALKAGVGRSPIFVPALALSLSLSNDAHPHPHS